MNNLIKKAKDPIKSKNILQKTNQHQGFNKVSDEINDDQEDQMISQNPKFSTNLQQKSTKSLTSKYYHVSNPNLYEDEFEQDQSEKLNCKMLSLKGIIVFLLVLSLVLVGVYKIIQEIYQIQHPESVMNKKMTQNRMSMTKQSSLIQKQQIKVQGHQNNLVDNKEPIKIESQINRLQITQQKYQENIKGKNMLKKQNENKEGMNNNQVKQNLPNKNQDLVNNEASKKIDIKQRQQIESFIKEKEQDIKDFQNSDKSPSNIEKTSDQNKNNKNKKQITLQSNKQHKNPIIHTSQSFFWNMQGNGPIPKANITKQQALKWKTYVNMIQLPINMPYQDNSMLKEEYDYYQTKYNISQFKQLPICVVIPTYNNADNERYKINIQSILQQNYSNYHIVLIDDKSDDKTGQLVQQYVNTFQPKYQEKVKVIINQQRKMAMPNLRYAANNQCKDNQLFIIVDGDDSLIGRQVFKLFSAVMQKKDLWVMWTNFLSPKGSIGYSRQYAITQKTSNNYRKAGFVMSHLRAYYTKLFRLIKEDDLKDQNDQYYHAANDVAIGIPILQMAHQHTGYIPQISYFYNMNTGLNNHKVRLKEQKSNDKKIRKKDKYEALTYLQFENDNIFDMKISNTAQIIVEQKDQMLKMQKQLHPYIRI